MRRFFSLQTWRIAWLTSKLILTYVALIFCLLAEGFWNPSRQWNAYVTHRRADIFTSHVFAYTNIAEIELFARPYAETWRDIYEEDHSLKEVNETDTKNEGSPFNLSRENSWWRKSRRRLWIWVNLLSFNRQR